MQNHTCLSPWIAAAAAAILNLPHLAAAAPVDYTGSTSTASATPRRAERSPAGTQQPVQAEARAYWEQGRALQRKGQLDLAEQKFRKATEFDPQAYAPVLALADVALYQGRLPQAETWMQRARQLAPRSAEVAAASGRLALAMNKPQDALAEFRRAVALDPTFVTPHLDMGEMQLGSGRATEAAASFRAARAADPQHPGAAFGLGRALVAQGRLADAEGAFEAAAAVDLRNPLPLVALGEVQSRQGRHEAALASLARALKLEPDLPAARLGQVDALAAAGQLAPAAEALTRLAQGAKGSPGALLYTKLAQIQQADRLPVEAAASLRRALELDAKFHPALNNFAWLAANQGKDLDQALSAARRAVDLVPGNASYNETLGAVLMARKDPGPAAAALRKARELDAGNPDFAYRHGLALERHGESAEALAAYRSALELNKPFASAEDARRRVAELARTARN